jgi:hypothetical protein
MKEDHSEPSSTTSGANFEISTDEEVDDEARQSKEPTTDRRLSARSRIQARK